MKKKGEIILTGDFNAKINYNNDQAKQKQSPNGKILQQLIDEHELVVANHQSNRGNWTWQNRKKNEENSIIDYILISKNLASQLKEIQIDEIGSHRIKGNKESDHNTILLSLGTEITREQKMTTRWKLDNKEGWKKFNEKIQTVIKNNDFKSQEDLQEMITKTLRSTVGETKIRTGTQKKRESQEIKKLREIKRASKKNYETAIKLRGNNDTIKNALDTYFEAQRKLKEAIKSHIEKQIKDKLTRLGEEGYTNSNTFWKMRAEKEGKGEIDPYDTITEDGKLIEDPQEAKNYIADYYENLYQAREGKPEYQKWTEKIENRVKEI